MNDTNKRKNILDLHFHKYLIIASTSVIIAFTYFIGVGVAIMTKQIRLDDWGNISILFVISVAVIGACSIFLFKAIFHLRNIPKVVKNL